MADDKLEILISAKNSSAVKALDEVDRELKKLGNDAKATAAGINVTANRIDALKRSQSAAAGTAAELAASHKNATAAATQLGGKVGWVNQQLVGLKAGIGHARALTGELHSVADAAMKAGARTTGIGLFGAGLAIKGGIGAFAEREQQIAALKAMSSSAEEAERKLADLKELAQLPGLELPALIKGQVALAGVDMEADRANRTMKAFANATVLGGGGVEEMERALKGFRDIMSKGTISAEDLKGQLIENMPIASKALKEAFGTQNAEKIQAMGLTMDQFADRLVTALEKFPTVAGGLKNDLNNLKQAWVDAQVKVGEGMMSVGVSDNLKALQEKLFGSDEAAKRFGQDLGKLLNVGLKLASFAADHSDQIIALAKAYFYVMGPLRLVVGGGLKFAVMLTDAKTVLMGIPGAAGKAAAGVTALKTALGGVTLASGGALAGIAVLGAYAVYKWNEVRKAINETNEALKQGEERAKAYNSQLDDMVKRGMMSEADAAKNAAPVGPRPWWDKFLGWETGGLIETPWQRRQREWQESPVTGMGRAKPGMSVRDEQAAAAAKERAAKTAADDAEAMLKRAKEAEGVEERRLKLAEARVALAKAEGAGAAQMLGLEKALAAQHEKVWAAKLAAAQAEGDTAKLLEVQLEIEAEKLGLRTKAAEEARRVEKERAEEAKKAADEAKKAADESLKLERERADRALSLREAELEHARAAVDYAKATGASAETILKLEAGIAKQLEDAYRHRLGIAQLQERNEKDATAVAREQLGIATERLRLETQIAEEKLRGYKDAYDFSIREAELRADIAREQAGSVTAQGGDARGLAAQAQAWQDWANRLKLGRAGLEGPGEAHLERLAQFRDVAAENRRRQEDAQRERERSERESDREVSRAKSGGGGQVISLAERRAEKGPDRLMSAIFGGDPGRVADILQQARRATGTYGAADPYEALRRPDTRGLDTALVRALETRDRVLIETVIDAIARSR